MAVLERQTSDGVVILRLNRPEIGNALNEELIQALHSTLLEEQDSKTTSAVIFTGAGAKFCTGADLKEMLSQRERFQPTLAVFFKTLKLISEAPYLTASFVNGDCLGGGLGIALSTDYILASEGARFGTPEITKGVFPFIISHYLIEKLGAHATNTLCYGGRFLNSTEASLLGIPSEVVSVEQFEKRSSELTALWKSVPRETLRSGKEVLRKRGALPEKEIVEKLTHALKNLGGPK